MCVYRLWRQIELSKCEQKFENINNGKIKGAYAIIQLEGKESLVEIMTMNQIRQTGMKEATKGQSPAYKNFLDMMAEKIIIGCACNLFITTSDDSNLIDNHKASPIQEP